MRYAIQNYIFEGPLTTKKNTEILFGYNADYATTIMNSAGDFFKGADNDLITDVTPIVNEAPTL